MNLRDWLQLRGIENRCSMIVEMNKLESKSNSRQLSKEFNVIRSMYDDTVSSVSSEKEHETFISLSSSVWTIS